MIEICLDIEKILKFDSLEVKGQECRVLLVSAALEVRKNKYFTFKKIKGSCVWGYDKFITANIFESGPMPTP